MLERLSALAWSWPTVGLFLLARGYFSVRTGWFQIFGLRIWWRCTVGQLRGGGGSGLSPLQTLSTT
ncbi:MAG: amino acid carrier protein, partial [Clostridiales bacterium]|nr:amino acid carrier protein [Clostridiales bacterium]